MASSGNKTTAGDGDVDAFIDAVADDQRRGDARLIVTLMRETTGQPAVMWGRVIVGFGSRHYRYPSGRRATCRWSASPRARRRRCSI